MGQTIRLTGYKEIASALREGAADEIIVEGEPIFIERIEKLVETGRWRALGANSQGLPAILMAVIFSFFLLVAKDSTTPVLEIWGSSLIWGIVIVVAIVVVYLIVRLALNSGHKVEVSWRISQVGSGRLVITKVEKPIIKRQRGAKKTEKGSTESG